MKIYGGYIWRGANWAGLRPQNPPGKAGGNGRTGMVATGDMEEWRGGWCDVVGLFV